MSFLFVALGGAVGAIGRYAISLILVKMEFLVLTLITNIIGAIIIGFIVGVVNGREGVSENTVLFRKTGICWGEPCAPRIRFAHPWSRAFALCQCGCMSTCEQARSVHPRALSHGSLLMRKFRFFEMNDRT